jgi:hypothetical protein
MRQLGIVALADYQGRNPHNHEPLKTGFDLYQTFFEHAEQASVAHQIEQPILLGRHLIGIVKPGPTMGKLLKKAYSIQIEEGITDINELKRRILKR